MRGKMRSTSIKKWIMLPWKDHILCGKRSSTISCAKSSDHFNLKRPEVCLLLFQGEPHQSQQFLRILIAELVAETNRLAIVGERYRFPELQPVGAAEDRDEILLIDLPAMKVLYHFCFVRMDLPAPAHI